MKFSIRFKIGNHFGPASKYTLRELCVSVVDRYSLTDGELSNIVTLDFGEVFENEDMQVSRVAK